MTKVEFCCLTEFSVNETNSVDEWFSFLCLFCFHSWVLKTNFIEPSVSIFRPNHCYLLAPSQFNREKNETIAVPQDYWTSIHSMSEKKNSNIHQWSRKTEDGWRWTRQGILSTFQDENRSSSTSTQFITSKFHFRSHQIFNWTSNTLTGQLHEHHDEIINVKKSKRRRERETVCRQLREWWEHHLWSSSTKTSRFVGLVLRSQSASIEDWSNSSRRDNTWVRLKNERKIGYSPSTRCFFNESIWALSIGGPLAASDSE